MNKVNETQYQDMVKYLEKIVSCKEVEQAEQVFEILDFDEAIEVYMDTVIAYSQL